ncbi:MAG: helix-turn-helix domain-containing protein [Rikenellaceae bacterium]|nr:helix-turn-helix domain-containing protein [Rikenellaceae bacterium]
MNQYKRDTELLQIVADRLKKWRIEHGKTQNDVYIDININPSRVESGKSSTTLTILSTLCQYYGKSLEELFKDL